MNKSVKFRLSNDERQAGVCWPVSDVQMVGSDVKKMAGCVRKTKNCECGIPCSMKILREFYFADWRLFVVCGN